MVFYRKYRPQNIAELDSEELRETLINLGVDKEGIHVSVPHAFLFTGPKGLGKTSTARIIAKVVNCEKHIFRVEGSNPPKKTKPKISRLTPDQIEPCGDEKTACSQCKSIMNGTNLDVLEIDGASNRGIDEIRDLREKIKLSPVSASKKVYIIDEVHMLTTEAFNALLKTLEEPPSHVIFILCTTEPHKVPETIKSRCRHIPFKLATKEELLRSFKRICSEEKLNIDVDALEYIAGMSEGSFRDGVKVLDEMASIGQSLNKKITKELIEEKYKVSGIKYKVSELIEFLEKKDTKKALKLISELVETGVDMKYFIEKLVGELHFLVLFKVGVEDSKLNPSGRRTNFEISDLKNLIELFTKAYGELKYAVLAQLPLEIAIIEWATQQVQKNEENHKKTQNLTQKDAESNFSVVPRIVQRSSASNTSDKKAVRQDNRDDSIWSKLIENVKTYNHSLAGILRGCSLKNFDGKSLEIETAYKFHKERLENNKAMEILEKAVEEISGKSAKIVVALKER